MVDSINKFESKTQSEHFCEYRNGKTDNKT